MPIGEVTQSTVVAMSAPPPAKFFEFPGEPPLNFSIWYRLFERFIYLTNECRPTDRKLTDETNNSILFSYLGSEGARLFASNPAFSMLQEARHADFVAEVKAQFVAATNPARSHFEFQHRLQASGESVADYVTNLRSLMADCDFHGHDKYHLALQLACGCLDKDAQKALLTQKSVDLDEFIRVLQADESARESAAAIRSVPTVLVQKVQAAKQQQEDEVTGTRSTDIRCLGCGKQGHKYKSDNCKARTSRCNYCNNVGHFESHCFKKKKDHHNND